MTYLTFLLYRKHYQQILTMVANRYLFHKIKFEKFVKFAESKHYQQILTMVANRYLFHKIKFEKFVKFAERSALVIALLVANTQ